MKEIAIEITGRTPLLLHRFTDAAAEAATSGARSAVNGDRGTPREQAEQCLYISEDDGAIVIPQPNLLRAIIDAGKFHKAGKSKVTTQKSSLIPACVDLDEIEYPLEHEEPWDVDTRPVRIPATGGRILRHRARFNQWKLRFVVMLDDKIIGLNVFRAIMDDAGSKIGLGDFRPDCKGPFGKFWITSWEPREPHDRSKKAWESE